MSTKNLLAVYEQAKELHFLGRDDDSLQLIEKLIRTDQNYALRVCNDKNFESLWDRIENLIKSLRDELANKLAKEFSEIRVLGKKGNEQLSDIKFPGEEQIREFEQFYHSELMHTEFGTDITCIKDYNNLMQVICNDFDSLAKTMFNQDSSCNDGKYKDVVNSDKIIKNIYDERTSWKNEFDKVESNIELKIGRLESVLEKENDYFSVRDKYSNFCGSKLFAMINVQLEAFDKIYEELKNDVKIIQSYLDAQHNWDKKKAELRDKYEDEITREWSEIHNSWKRRINGLRKQLSSYMNMDFDEALSTIISRYSWESIIDKLRQQNLLEMDYDKMLDNSMNEITYHYLESLEARVNALRQEFSYINFDEKPVLEAELNTMESRLKKIFEYFGNQQEDDYYSIVKKYKKLKKDKFLQNSSSYFEWSLSELEKKLNVYASFFLNWIK